MRHKGKGPGSRNQWPRLLWLAVFVAAAAGAVVLWLNSREHPDPARRAGPPPRPATETPDTAAPDPARTNNATANAGPLASSSTPLPGPPPVPRGANQPALAYATPVLARGVLGAQIALARHGMSPGSIDGVLGPQTRAALLAFQEGEGLALTGDLDPRTLAVLRIAEPVFTHYVVSEEDLGRLRPLGTTWLSKSEQDVMDFETILELISERSWSHPNLIRQLNSGVDWNSVTPGTVVQVPFVQIPAVRSKGAWIRIQLAAKVLDVFDGETNRVAHFPCSIGQRVENRPVGELYVATVAEDPNYTFNPQVFPESEEARQLDRKLILAPGPNNPVGTAWIGLDLPGYGIHGAPLPEKIGRTESHGCFRLANWNAEFLLRLVWVGMPVQVVP